MAIDITRTIQLDLRLVFGACAELLADDDGLSAILSYAARISFSRLMNLNLSKLRDMAHPHTKRKSGWIISPIETPTLRRS